MVIHNSAKAANDIFEHVFEPFDCINFSTVLASPHLYVLWPTTKGYVGTLFNNNKLLKLNSEVEEIKIIAPTIDTQAANTVISKTSTADPDHNKGGDVLEVLEEYLKTQQQEMEVLLNLFLEVVNPETLKLKHYLKSSLVCAMFSAKDVCKVLMHTLHAQGVTIEDFQ